MFFTRHDGALRKGLARRIKSPRASVYLEFAIVMPLVAIVISFLFEFISLWDARCMANHAAWVCGRIASVDVGARADDKTGASVYQESTKKNDLLTKDMETATMYLMSTCSMGGMGVRVGQGAPSFKSSAVTDVVETPYASLQNCFTVSWKELFSDIFKNLFPDCGETGLIAKLRDLVVNWLTDLVTKAVKPLTDRLDAVTKAVIFKDATDISALTGVLCSTNHLWQFESAEKRMKKYGKNRIFNIVQCDADVEKPSQCYFALSEYGQNSIDFPRQALTAGDGLVSQTSEWMVNGDYGWPWCGQHQRMIDVKIYWPFERAWLWQALAFRKQTVSDTSCVAAHGRAIVYPQPIISNKDLDSTDPPEFKAVTNDTADVVAQLQAEYNNFLKTIWFWYKYRMHEESVYDYDTDVGGLSSHHFLSGGRINWDTKNQHAAWGNWDGLYNWMTCVLGDDIEAELQPYGNQTEKAKDKLKGGVSKKIWNRFETSFEHGRFQYRTESYLRSFREFFDNQREPLGEYNFSSGSGTVLSYFTPDSDYRYGYEYRSKNWFYWHIDNAKTEFRRRYDHFTTDDLNGTTKGLSGRSALNASNAKGYGYFDIFNANYYKLRKWAPDGSEVVTSNETASGICFMITGYMGPNWPKKDDRDWSQTTCLWPFNKKDPAMKKVEETIRNLIANDVTYKNWRDETDKKGKKVNEDFDLDDFAADAVEYYIDNMFGIDEANHRIGAPYRICARWLFQQTANPASAAQEYMDKEQAVYDKLTGKGANSVWASEAASTNIIAQCCKELGQNLGMESGSSTDIIDGDQMASVNGLSADVQEKLKKTNDPEEIKKIVKDYFDEQKKKVFAALQKVDEAEQILSYNFNVEEGFKRCRDARLAMLYEWISQEILVRYGNSLKEGKYDGYYVKAFLPTFVARDNRFLNPKPEVSFERLANEWCRLLDALTAADKAFGQTLGLACVVEKKGYGNQEVDPDGNVIVKDPATPGPGTSSSGSDDDLRGDEWTHHSDIKRWTPTASGKDGWQ